MSREKLFDLNRNPLYEYLSDDLKDCICFHGHFCPGLAYGYLVAKEAIVLLDLIHSPDEEAVVVSENDSCAVDAVQVLLGTTIGKGNLIINNYGKNIFTGNNGGSYAYELRVCFCRQRRGQRV